jgi:mannosyltransferase OCH1-like enzyme
MIKKILIIIVIIIIIFIINNKKLLKRVNLPAVTKPKINKNIGNLPIPLVIYRMWHQYDVNKKMYDESHQTLVDLNPEFTINWYDLNKCREFMKSFDERVYKVWDKLKPIAFKCDLWRICVIYKYGGVYLDAKVKCFYPIREITKDCWNKDSNNQFIVAIENYIKNLNLLHNGFIISTPRHPFLLNYINKIVYNVENMNKINLNRLKTEPFILTGPHIFHNSVKEITKKLPIKGKNNHKNKELNYYLLEYKFLNMNKFGLICEGIYKNKELLLVKKFDITYCYLYKKIIGNNYFKMAFKGDIFN